MQETKTNHTISAQAADRLIAAHDGHVALLYLYILRRGGLDRETAARELCLTLREIGDAEEKLRRLDLLPGEKKAAETSEPREISPPAEELPQYLAADLARRSREDPTFSDIVKEGARIIGRNLNSNDMRILFGIYDYLSLPPEVIFMLLNFCAEQYQEKYGDSRRPTSRAIEKLAYEWARLEIMTIEQAEAYISARKARLGELGRIKAQLNIFGRDLTATEEKYVASWIDMGFGEDAAAIAYDRTVTKTGGLKWPYMNKIFLSWHEKGLHSAREIEEKDGRRPAPRRKSGGGERAVTMQELDDIFNKI